MRTSTRFALNSASNWALNTVQIGVGAVILPYAVGHLGPTQFGLYRIVGAVLSFLSLFDLGLSATVFRFSAQDQGARDLNRLRETTSTAMLVMSGLGVIGALLLSAGAPLMKSFFRVDDQYYSDFLAIDICLAVSFALRFASYTSLGVLNGGNRYDLGNGVEILGNLLRLGLLFLLFECWRPTLLLFGLTFVLHQVVRLVGFHYLARFRVIATRIYSWSAVSRAAFKRLTSFSLINGVNMLGWLLITEGPNVVIGKMLGFEMVTAYQAPWLVSTQLRTFVAGLCSPLVPLAARDAIANDGRNLGEWSVRLSRLACVLSVALVLPVCLLARPLLCLWMGAGYAWTAPILIISVAAQLVAGVQAANYYLMLGGGPLVNWAVSELLSAVVALLVAVLGQVLFHWGILGMVSGASAVIFARNLAYLPLLACRQFRISPGRYYWQTYGLPLISALPATAISWGLLQLAPPTGWIGLIVHGLVNLAVYTAAAWRVAFPMADRAVVRGLAQALWSRAVGRPPEEPDQHSSAHESKAGEDQSRA